MFLNKFEKEWNNAKNNIFRLESLPEYKVENDLKNFEKFKKGLPYIANKDKKWFKKLSSTKNRGLIIKRVRIVKLPLSDYLKYEIDFWQKSIKYGEQILFLKQNDYQKIITSIKFEPEDFWMFDDKKLIIFHYNISGEWIGEEVISEQNIIDKYKNVKQELIRHSVLMQKFLN